ncbi:solute carrier family 66 member 2 [Pelomyxa schiedti]|nr:solute carrier family 66 member 2 [Pelomyxa schiedti]
MGVGGLAVGLAVVLGPPLCWVPQLNDMYRRQDSEGFSMFVCLALLVANTLRLCYALVSLDGIGVPLVAQSVVMVVVQLAVVYVCVLYRRPVAAGSTGGGIIPRSSPHSAEKPQMQLQSSGSQQQLQQTSQLQQEIDVRAEAGEAVGGVGPPSEEAVPWVPSYKEIVGQFWDWDHYSHYLFSFFCIAVFCLLSITLMSPVHSLVQAIGFLGASIEALIGAPQIYHNAQHQIKGLALSLILLWLCADVLKCAYFFLWNSPAQFKFCGVVQFVVDSVLLGQHLWYPQKSKRRIRNIAVQRI